MKRHLIALLLIAGSVNGAEISPKFIKAINLVESSGREGFIWGDNQKSLGGFQIRKECWKDATSYKNIGGKYTDCAKNDYSTKVLKAYLERYGKHFIETNNYEALAKIWNGGPAGPRNPNTQQYWNKVKKYL
jgi:hypothetical protein